MNTPEDVYKAWEWEFDGVYQYGSALVLTMHPKPRSLEFIAERGFVYDSSLMADDAPYFVDTPTGRLVEIPVDWAIDDAHYYSFNRGAGSMK